MRRLRSRVDRESSGRRPRLPAVHHAAGARAQLANRLLGHSARQGVQRDDLRRLPSGRCAQRRAEARRGARARYPTPTPAGGLTTRPLVASPNRPAPNRPRWPQGATESSSMRAATSPSCFVRRACVSVCARANACANASVAACLPVCGPRRGDSLLPRVGQLRVSVGQVLCGVLGARLSTAGMRHSDLVVVHGCTKTWTI